MSLNRIVAVKLLLAGEFASKTAMDRFRTEAEAAASLHHPNIVTIHETGEQDGRTYFSMDFVEGQTLAERVRATPLAPRQAAGYVQKIAAAVHYAHSKGVLHRDLKPSNVLIDETDEPRITDFGLAKRFAPDLAATHSTASHSQGAGVGNAVERVPTDKTRERVPATKNAAESAPAEKEVNLTLSGQVLGSPNFMPPEQASAKWGAVGPRSDVYGLGGILYYLLTGRPPFHAATVTDTLDQVLNSDPGSPRVLNPSVPVDLETICLKCLEKEPLLRYGSAQAVADELERFLRGEPIRARPLGPLGRTWRWSRRRPALASLVAAFALLALVIIVGSPIAIARIERERQRAEGEALRNKQLLYAADMSLIPEALRQNKLGRAVELLERHRPKPGESDQRGWEWRYLWQESQSDESMTLGRHSNVVGDVILSPDGGTVASAGWDGCVKICDLISHRQMAELPHNVAVYSVALSQDGTKLATGSSAGTRIWDVKTWRPWREISSGDLTFSVALSRDGKMAGIYGLQGVALWSLITGNVITNLGYAYSGTEGGRMISFSPDDRLLAYAKGEAVNLWDVGERRQRVCLVPNAPRGKAMCVSFSPDGRLLASGEYGPRVNIWDIQTCQLVTSLTHGGRVVRSVSFSPAGDLLVSVGDNQQVRLWDTRTWQDVVTYRGHQAAIWSAGFSSDGQLLATGDEDGAVKLWDLRRRPAGIIRLNHPTDLYPFLYRRAYPTRGGNNFMLVRSNLTFSVWDKSLKQTARYGLPLTNYVCGALSPNGHLVALGSADGNVGIWELPGMHKLAQLRGVDQGRGMLCFSPDSRILAGVVDYSVIRIWDMNSRSEVATLKDDHAGTIQTLVFSSDGKILAAPHWQQGQVCLWDVASRRELGVFTGHRVGARDAAISPDGTLVATTGGDETARLWNLRTQKELAVLRPVSRAYSVAFSVDGSRLAIGGFDGLVSVFHTKTRQELATLTAPLPDPVEWLEFLPDGNTLLVSTSNQMFAWRAPSFSEIEAAENARARSPPAARPE